MTFASLLEVAQGTAKWHVAGAPLWWVRSPHLGSQPGQITVFEFLLYLYRVHFSNVIEAATIAMTEPFLNPAFDWQAEGKE
ncbi:MAG: hypothetical protein ACWA5A_01945 [Marinibacterium sp.]